MKVWIYKGDITNKELAREQPLRSRRVRSVVTAARAVVPRTDAPVAAGVEA